MTDLADFLLARIAEDEAVAHDQRHSGEPEWWPHQRVLAECAAKQRIVDEAQRARAAAASIAETFMDDASRRAADERSAYNAADFAWTVALVLLAIPYAGHPDYREEWRP